MEYREYQLKRTKRMFNFKLIGLGLIFLADYNAGVIDVLPDFVGLIIILAAIGKSAYINNNFDVAVRWVRIWLGVAFVKAVLNCVEIFLIEFNDSDMLMFAAVFGMTELIIALIVFGNILAGCDIFIQTDCIPENYNRLKYLPLILKIFFSLKFVLQIMSQTPLLLSESTYDFLSVKYNVYFTLKMIKDILLPPCVILSTLAGLLALSLAIPFFSSMSKSNALNEIIKIKINSLLVNDRLFMLKKTFDAAFVFFAAGIFFCMDFEADKINFLPDFTIYICLMAGMKILHKFDPQTFDRKSNIYMLSGLFVSVAAYIFTTAYRAESLHFFTDLVLIFRICSIFFCLLSNVLLFAVLVRFFEQMRKLKRIHINFAAEYLGKYITRAEINHAINKKYKTKFTIVAAIAASAKVISYFLGDVDEIIVGIYKFFVAVILFAFAIFSVRYIFKTKNEIYSYYS